jgi:hydroxysqualene synthase
MSSEAPAPSHYENFPVASILCPPRLRPPIAAIYAFARTADDIADEGNATAGQRLADLAQMRADLCEAARSSTGSGRWPQVFEPLAVAIRNFRLPLSLLDDLLQAFEQDVIKTHGVGGAAATYADEVDLLDYCRRSANPVGRLLLHLHGIDDEEALAMSDHICTALQLINFWQDLGQDIQRGRHYLTDTGCTRHGVSRANLSRLQADSKAIKLIAECSDFARASMLKGSPLPARVPGRAGWELRLVVQGGLRILDKIEALGFDTLNHRPKLKAPDVLVMVWRALWM